MAITAHDIHFTGSAYGETTARAGIFTGTGGLFGGRALTAHTTGTGDSQLIAPVLRGTEGAQDLCGLGDTPANTLVVVDGQAALFGLLFETLIMIGTAPAGVLDIVDLTVVMDHFMDKGSDGIRNGAVQGFSGDIDFMVGLLTLVIPPDFRTGEVPIGAGGGLDGNNVHLIH